MKQKWQVWPTTWAGGSNSVQVDGNSTAWINDENGNEVCRLRPENGRVTAAVYDRANKIVNAVNAMDDLKVYLIKEMVYLRGICRAATLEKPTTTELAKYAEATGGMIALLRLAREIGIELK